MGALTKMLGRRISDQRRLAGLTQAQLAEKLGIATESLSRIETGAAVPSLGRVEAIASAIDIELIELFRFRKRRTPESEAVDRLLWLVSRRRVSDIELVTEIAARIFEHTRLVGAAG